MKKYYVLMCCLLFAAISFGQQEDEKVEVKKEVKVNVTKKGDGERMVKIITIVNGAESIIEWTDDGEIPEDVQRKLEEGGIDIHILESDEDSDDHEIKVILEGGDFDEGENIWINDAGGRNVIIIKKDDDDHYSSKRKHKICKQFKGKGHNKIIIVDDDGEEKVIEWQGDCGHSFGDVEDHEFHGKKMRKHMGNHALFFSEGDLHGSHMSDAYMGAQIGSADEGVKVLEIIKDGPADKAGFETGDVIQKINGAYTKSVDNLMTLLGMFEPNDKVEIELLREGKEKKINLTLGQRPDHYK